MRAPEVPIGKLLFLKLSAETLQADWFTADDLVELVTRANVSRKQIVIELDTNRTDSCDRITSKLDVLREYDLRSRWLTLAHLDVLRRTVVDFVKVEQQLVVLAQTNRVACAILLAVVGIAMSTDVHMMSDDVATTDALDLVYRQIFKFSDELVAEIEDRRLATNTNEPALVSKAR